MTSLEALDVALDAIAADIRGIKFSKTYALALPGPVARLDRLEQARETLSALRDLIADQVAAIHVA
jgi:DNA-binding IclR family transcriptional regulator